jgi:hypothetical protein
MPPRKASSLSRPTPPRTVLVVGAGFSAGLGYPLVNDLLIRLWSRIPNDEKEDLKRVIAFHHPGFDPKRKTSFPNIETLLSEMAANEQLFAASRDAQTRFSLDKLRKVRESLLYSIANWFHKIYQDNASKTSPWLETFKRIVLNCNATVISFNWDLVIDHLIFGDELCAEDYGLGQKLTSGPLLIKPHGSLNWYDEKQGQNLSAVKRFKLYASKKETVYAFTKFREPRSSSNRLYSPLIIPPVLNKNFQQEIFTPLWRKCASEISVAKRVVFLGYSLPDADLHARFILRCGFHNQIEGLPVSGGRAAPVGPASVTIVNPDLASARRIEGVIDRNSRSNWQPFTVEKWFEELARKRSR